MAHTHRLRNETGQTARPERTVSVSVCEEEGGGGKKKVSERERERSDSTFLNCMSAQMYQKSLHGWI